MGRHDLVRRIDRQGEVLIWCRKCSGCARQRMGPKLMNCCRPERMGTQGHGNMLKRIQILEDGKIPTKEVTNWRTEGQRRRTWRDLLQKPENWSDFEPDTRVEVLVVLDVTDVFVSPSSVVSEFCDGFSGCSDWEYVELQSFSFSKKRVQCCTITQEEMRYESTQVKAPLLSRKRMRSPTPLQNSNSSFGEELIRFLVQKSVSSVLASIQFCAYFAFSTLLLL